MLIVPDQTCPHVPVHLNRKIHDVTASSWQTMVSWVGRHCSIIANAAGFLLAHGWPALVFHKRACARYRGLSRRVGLRGSFDDVAEFGERVLGQFDVRLPLIIKIRAALNNIFVFQSAKPPQRCGTRYAGIFD